MTAQLSVTMQENLCIITYNIVQITRDLLASLLVHPLNASRRAFVKVPGNMIMLGKEFVSNTAFYEAHLQDSETRLRLTVSPRVITEIAAVLKLPCHQGYIRPAYQVHRANCYRLQQMQWHVMLLSGHSHFSPARRC